MVDSSRLIAYVAREIGVHEITLGYWVKAYREKHAAEGKSLDMPGRARLRELERRNRELEMENALCPFRGLRGDRAVRHAVDFLGPCGVSIFGRSG